jgi:hypothetical protein
MSNGEELGDPGCVWVKGEVPERVVNITHPGQKHKDGSAFRDPPFQLWMILHSACMVIACFGFIPYGIYAVVISRDRRRKTHKTSMGLAGIMVSLGFITAVLSEFPARSTHGIYGTVLFSLGAAQYLLALTRRYLPFKSHWRRAHVFAGKCIVLLLPYPIVSGYMSIHAEYLANMVMLAPFSMYACGLLLEWLTESKRR